MGLRKLSTVTLLALASSYCGAAEPKTKYFELGAHLIEEFQVTNYSYISKDRYEFVRTGANSYRILTSRTQNGIPDVDKLLIRTHRTDWVLGWSGETSFSFPHSLRDGATWHQRIRGARLTYTVEATDDKVVVPAGEFKHCARISIAWIAHASDESGPQRSLVYLAPHLGIIKEQDWDNSDLEIERVLTKYSDGP